MSLTSRVIKKVIFQRGGATELYQLEQTVAIQNFCGGLSPLAPPCRTFIGEQVLTVVTIQIQISHLCFCLTSLVTCLSCELVGSRSLYVSSYPTRCQSFVFNLVQPGFQTWEPRSLINRPSCWLFCLVGGWRPLLHVALHPRLLTLVMSPRRNGVVWLKPVVCARGLILTGKTQQHQTPERQQSGTLSLTV